MEIKKPAGQPKTMPTFDEVKNFIGAERKNGRAELANVIVSKYCVFVIAEEIDLPDARLAELIIIRMKNK